MSARKTLAGVASELPGTARSLSCLGAAVRHRARGTVRAPHGREVVILVNGYGTSDWRRVKTHLEASGYTVDVFAYLVLHGTLHSRAAQLAQRIVWHASTSGKPVHLVGHSLGGLIARAAIQRNGGRNVATCTTVATPHRGSAAARLDPLSALARAMRPGSDELVALDAAETAGAVTFHHVVAAGDQVVPAFSQHLTAVASTCHTLDGARHVTVVRDRRLLDVLTGVLARRASAGQRPSDGTLNR